MSESTVAIANELLAENAALKAKLNAAHTLLKQIRDAGTWYPSALEIDEFRDNRSDGDGVELLKRIEAMVGPSEYE